MNIHLRERVESQASIRPELSEIVCWSRMHAHAGQNLSLILARKELERRTGEGLFFWGVGNAPGQSLTQVAKAALNVDVVFSLMKSQPKAADVSASEIFVWRRYFDMHNYERPLPIHSLITSRGYAAGQPRRGHYALMCRADRPLTLGDFGIFDPSAYRNVSRVGAPVGSSQVTALLRRVNEEGPHSDYRINFYAKLVDSYWVKLSDPVRLSDNRRIEMARELAQVLSYTRADWRNIVAELREGPSVEEVGNDGSRRLL
jgi:hypothetical protein